MPARAPAVSPKRNYTDSVEDINGAAPAVDQIALAEDINDHTETLQDHKESIDRVEFDSALRYREGYTGERTWILNSDGTPTDYHAAQGSTPEQRGATLPGTDPDVWAVGRGAPDPYSMAFSYTARQVQSEISDLTTMGFR